MADLRTEEEQLEALKNWWKKNGTAIVLAVVAAIAGTVGWQTWNARQAAQNAEASRMYENLTDAVRVSMSGGEVGIESIHHLSEELKDKHARSGYAGFAALLMARVAVEAGDLNEAQAQLSWVIEHAREQDLRTLASIRKAQLLLTLEELEQARQLLRSVTPGAYASLWHEVMGDLHYLEGDAALARDAYLQAKSFLGGQSSVLIQLKIDDLGGVGS